MRTIFNNITGLAISFLAPISAYCADANIGPEAVKNKLKNIGEKGAGFESISLPSITIAMYAGTIARALLVSAGVIFFALIAYSGYLWMVSGANEEMVKRARTIMIRALIGLIIVIFAGALVQFVIFYVLP